MGKLMKMPGATLRQLAYFVTVAEEGTISAAAERLHVSESAVALAVTELERALKVQLCVRRKARGITLTPSGTRVLHQARSLLRQAEELETEASGSAGELSGLLSIGCFMALGATVLPGLLQGFSEVHPHVTIDFEEGIAQHALQRKLLDGELDLAILYDVDLAPELDRVELFRLRPYILLPANHRLAGEEIIALHDLVHEPLVLLQAPPSADHAMAMYHRAGVVPLIRYRATSFETARSLVGRGLGYAIAIQRQPNEQTYEGLPVVQKDISELTSYSIGVVLGWPRHTQLARRAQEFIRHSVNHGYPH